MSKKRAVAKYTALGAVTVAYTAGAWKALNERRGESAVTPQQAAIAAGILLALTWTAGLL